MECNLLINSVGSTNLPRFTVEYINGVRGNMASYKTRIGFHRMHKSFLVPTWKYNIPGTSWKIFCAPEKLEQQFSVVVSTKRAEVGESDPEASPEKIPAKPLSSDELKLLLADAERLKLLKKLSEANQYNRLLKRELQVKKDLLVNFKSELAVIELEIQMTNKKRKVKWLIIQYLCGTSTLATGISSLRSIHVEYISIDLQALVRLAEEIAKSDIPVGSRKIKGRYIQSHLFSRLGAIQEKLAAQIKDVEAAQAKEVPLSWVGVAESVQVMGSFDGWSQGEHLSPEYNGSYMHFSTTLFLRPGRYEIKFLVDGEWHLSPELPITGEGLTKNNLLIVE
ncbi:protein PTST, chloroplastic isoform X2 [Nicotiana tabacum]